MWYPHSLNLWSCSSVIGCYHIIVFIAGAVMIGLTNFLWLSPSPFSLNFMSQHLQTSVTKLSQSPFAILASVLALNGAIISASAHFLNSICKTGSPRFVHLNYSSSSTKHSTLYNNLSSSISSFLTNFLDWIHLLLRFPWGLAWPRILPAVTWLNLWPLSMQLTPLWQPRLYTFDCWILLTCNIIRYTIFRWFPDFFQPDRLFCWPWR